MEKYIVEKIKEFKIKNNLYSDLVVFEYDEFDYNEKKYINIYIYDKDNKNISEITINKSKSICINKIEDKYICATFLRDNFKGDFVINDYVVDSKKIKIDDELLIDYNNYDFDENNLTILKHLNLKGFKYLYTLPKTTKNYWICSCGQYNDQEECTNCGVLKGFVEYYDTEEKIHKKYAEKEYQKQKFYSNNLKEEIKYFKEKLLCSDFYINVNYLDDEFFDNLNNNTLDKLNDYKNRKNRSNHIQKIFRIVCIVAILLIIVSFIINNINEKKKLEDYITKFCDNNSYEKINNFDDIKDSTSCGSITYFVKNMNKNEANLEELMNSNNELIYTIYYKINKVNIHNEVEFEGIYPDAYIDHLYNNDFEISNDMLDDLLSHALIDKNVEKFTKYSKYLAKYGYTWSNASRYFNYGEDKLYLSSMEYEYVNNEEVVPKYTEFSMIYKENSGDYNCFNADLYDEDNIRFLISKKDDLVCSYALSNHVYKGDSKLITNYKNAGGSFKYSSYLGGFLYHMTYHLYPNSYDLDEFKEKIKLLVSYGDNINALLGNDDADPGYSPLDKFIYKNSSSCSYVYRGSANANQAKSCEISKQYYKVLKSYGARCNKKCDDEKYFK